MTTTQITKHDEHQGLLTPQGIAQTVEQLDLLKKLVESVLRKDADYGVIPGTGDKPTLLKPGADNVCGAFTVYASPGRVISERIEPEKGFVSYTVAVELVSHRSGQVVSGGIGQCNSYEPKYRYRWINGERQENPDPLGQANTILKMAEKRAYVDATMKLPGVARFFTQDLEEIQTDQKDQPSKGEPIRGPICQVHNKPFRKGKSGGFFCPTKVGEGWCNERPPSTAPKEQKASKPTNGWSTQGAVSPDEEKRAYDDVAAGFKQMGLTVEERKDFLRQVPGNTTRADSWGSMTPRAHVEAAQAMQKWLANIAELEATHKANENDISDQAVEETEDS